MLLVMFRSGGALYAVEARRVAEVIPKVGARPIPHAPPELLGLLSYRGRAVPVLDFGVLLGDGPSREVLSTRILLVEGGGRGESGRGRLVGLVAEDVSHVTDAEPGRVVAPPLRLDAAPYLGAVLRLDEGLVQLVEPDKLLSEGIERAVFGETTGAG